MINKIKDEVESEKVNMVVVSLFDGLSGGRIALDRTPHINVLRYYSSEVDKYAIKIADKNYPQDTKYRLGSVVDVDGKKLLEEIKQEFPTAKIMLIGGSPCQGFSMAGKLKGSSTKCGKDVLTLNQYLTLKEMSFEFDGQSYLFWEYVRIMHELKPDYFMLENVRVTKKWLPMFNEAMNTEPTRINSSLVSAQNRDRYYWHNLGDIEQPEDRGILLRDILEDSPDSKFNLSEKAIKYINRDDRIEKKLTAINGEKSLCLMAQYDQSKNGTFLCVDGNGRIDSKKTGTIPARYYKGAEAYGSSPFIREERPIVTIKTSRDTITTYRKLTPLECERLQTLPDSYTEGVSNTQRYKMIGNGWTIDVASHIFKHILDEI